MNDKTEQTLTDTLRHIAKSALYKTAMIGPSYLIAAADTIDDLRAQLAEAQDALQAAQRLFKEALPKFNWGASFLDANAIQRLNEVPVKVNAAIEVTKGDSNGN